MQLPLTIGVAGHVDHGKTSLVRILTGIDTDRKPEEKARGLSIDAGVAQLVLPSGREAALVDIPGHTDYLKNAIRGLSTVDAAILLVAADDGVMPQTREHLDILSFFGAQTGIAVLNKADLVDHETLEMGMLELAELMEGTFMQDAAIIPFSIHQPSSKGEILLGLEAVLQKCGRRSRKSPFHLWIDQVRSFQGVGTVASGTVSAGKIRQDDPVEIQPIQFLTRVRSLESHGRRVTEAVCGQRVGINLPGISLNEIQRGMVLAGPGSNEASYFLNVEVRVLSSISRGIKNRQKVKVHIGTSVTVGTIILMESSKLGPGERGLVQLRMSRPLPARARERFVLTLMNVPKVIAGGVVLEISHKKFRSAKAQGVIAYLKALQADDLDTFVEEYVAHDPLHFQTARKMACAAGFPEHQIEAAINSRVSRGLFLYCKGKGAVHKKEYEALEESVYAVIHRKVENNPLRKPINLSEIAAGMKEKVDIDLLSAVATDLVDKKRMIKIEGGYHLSDALTRYAPQNEAISEWVQRFAAQQGITPFSADTIWKSFSNGSSKREVQRLLDFMCTRKKLVRLNDNRFLTVEALEEIKERVQRAIGSKGSITIKDSKEILGYGRWGGVPVFDYLDKIGFTVRLDNERVLRDK